MEQVKSDFEALERKIENQRELLLKTINDGFDMMRNEISELGKTAVQQIAQTTTQPPVSTLNQQKEESTSNNTNNSTFASIPSMMKSNISHLMQPRQRVDGNFRAAKPLFPQTIELLKLITMEDEVLTLIIQCFAKINKDSFKGVIVTQAIWKLREKTSMLKEKLLQFLNSEKTRSYNISRFILIILVFFLFLYELANGNIFTASQQTNIAAQAAASFHIAIVVSQAFHLWMCLTRRVSIFSHGFANIVAIFAVIIDLLLICLFTFVPGVQYIFGSQPPPWQTWIVPVVVGIWMWIFNEARKYGIRNYPKNGFIRLIKW